MSAQQSNLSASNYGYDLVVATSQASINAALKQFLFDSGAPVVTKYYNQDADGNAVEVDRVTLLQQTNNTDPLKVGNWTATSGAPMSDDLQNINNSNFWFAFQAELGIPPYFALPANVGKIPDIIDIDAGGESVTFNMMCNSFTIVEANFTRKGLASYVQSTQPTDAMWLFTSTVKLATINDNNNLPAAVQAQVTQLSGEFSVQKLLLDLETASLATTPQIFGVAPSSTLYTMLNTVFVQEYFGSLSAKGQTVLNYTITQPQQVDPSTFRVAQVDLFAEQLVDKDGKIIAQPTDDQKQLLTLNYLCSVNGKTLPELTQFNWNWLDSDTDGADFDGVIAINRKTLADYYAQMLTMSVTRRCIVPKVNCAGINDYSKSSITFGALPTTTKPDTGDTILSLTYSATSSDGCGVNCILGHITLTTSSSLTVDFKDSSIIITQGQVIDIDITIDSNNFNGNIVDVTLVDTYALGIDDKGKLTTVMTSKKTDNSVAPPSSTLDALTGITPFVTQLQSVMQTITSAEIQDVPTQIFQNFVFPGGKTFVFKDAFFSDSRDLITHITYAEA